VSKSSYTERGVSPTKHDVHAAIADYDLGLYPGAFCKIVADAQRDRSYCSVMHADGAGTKSTVAYIHYRETGDPSVFRGIAQDSLVMNLDDLLCVGVTTDFVVSNTIGRNAHRIDGHILRELVAGYEEFAALMEPYGIRLVMAGGETADVGDLVATVIVDSTVFARMPRDEVIDCSTIRPNDVIVGLASFGQSSYEVTHNSGIASNGFTAARHMLMASLYGERYPETFSNTLSPDNVYAGAYALSDPLPGAAETVGDALLAPTRTYLPIMHEVFRDHRRSIHGVVQASGGGQVKCKAFGRHLHYVKDSLFPRPAIFRALSSSGLLEAREMYQVFNMGHRLEIFCGADVAAEVIAIAASYGVGAQVVGRVEYDEVESNRVTIVDQGDTFVFVDG
jgi:phosphoribosylformylglycinamidine cyclo-ligase